jgi:hypothetical protein
MSPPLVTIVTPAYNQERYIAECIESTLAQTYTNWEQVVVDDGSSDRTREVVVSYRDPRIRLVALPHRGLGALAETYNTALSTSRGSLVAILEGDDAWPADKLEVQVPVFEDPRVLLSWGRGATMDETSAPCGELVTVHTRASQARWSTRQAFHRLVRSNLFAPSLSVMVRRASLDAIGGFRQTGSTLFVDLPTWLWLTATLDGEVVFLDHVLGRYRVHEAQTTNRTGELMARQHLEVVQATVEALGPGATSRVGWTDSTRRSAVTRGRLASGERLLAARRFGEARRAFTSALEEANRMSDRLLAVGGIISSLVGVNLVRRAFEIRTELRRRLRWE